MQNAPLQLPNLPGTFPAPPIPTLEHQVLVDSPLYSAVLFPRWRTPEQENDEHTIHLVVVMCRRFDDSWRDDMLTIRQHVTDTRPVTLLAWLAVADHYHDWWTDRQHDEQAWIERCKEARV